MSLRGRNLINGLPQSVEISSIELREAMAPSVNVIIDAVRDALDETPPELVADLMEVGVCLAGGGAQIRQAGFQTGACIVVSHAVLNVCWKI